ncbi:hypothetical protein Tco_1389298 [Tanacetum coccineum]
MAGDDNNKNDGGSGGKKEEKNKGKAAYVKTKTSLIPGLTYEDYQLFLKHFFGRGNSEGTKPVANMAHKEDKKGELIFDSGCTEYITYLSDFLVNKKTTHFKAPVVIPNGDSILVKGKGDYIPPGGTKGNGVLYVPDFKCNLFSVSHLSRDLQCCISFFPDFCVTQGLQRKNLIGAGRCEGGLYRMKMVQGRRAMATTVKTGIKDLDMHQKGNLVKLILLKHALLILIIFVILVLKQSILELLFLLVELKLMLLFNYFIVTYGEVIGYLRIHEPTIFLQ